MADLDLGDKRKLRWRKITIDLYTFTEGSMECDFAEIAKAKGYTSQTQFTNEDIQSVKRKHPHASRQSLKGACWKAINRMQGKEPPHVIDKPSDAELTPTLEAKFDKELDELLDKYGLNGVCTMHGEKHET